MKTTLHQSTYAKPHNWWNWRKTVPGTEHGGVSPWFTLINVPVVTLPWLPLFLVVFFGYRWLLPATSSPPPLWTSAYTNPYLLGPQPSPSAPLLDPPTLPFLLINPIKPASASVSPSGSKTQSSPKRYSTLTPFSPVFLLSSPPPHWSLPRSVKFFHFPKCCTSPGIPLKTHGWFFVPECRENKHCLDACTQISIHYWIADIFTLTPHFRELFFQVELQELTVGLQFLLGLSSRTRLDHAGLRGFSGLCNPLALWTFIKWCSFQCFGVCSTFFTLKLGYWKISQWSTRDPNQKSNKTFNFCFYLIYYQNVNPKEQN